MLKKETVKKLSDLLSSNSLEGNAFYVDLKSFVINNTNYQYDILKQLKNHVTVGGYQGQAILRKYGNYWIRDDDYNGVEFRIEINFGRDKIRTFFSEDVNQDQIFKIIEVMIDTGKIYDINNNLIW